MLDNQLPINHLILGKLQNVFNLLPNLISASDLEAVVRQKREDGDVTMENTESPAAKFEMRDPEGNLQVTEFSDLNKALQIKTNDNLMIIYISSLINSIISFHDLIENKIENKNRILKNSGKGSDIEADDDKKEEKASNDKESEKKVSKK